MKEDTQSVSQVSVPLISELGFPGDPPWTLKRHPAGQFKVSNVNFWKGYHMRFVVLVVLLLTFLETSDCVICQYTVYVILTFQVFPPISSWTPLGSVLLLGLTGWSSSQSLAQLSKLCQSGTILIACCTTSGTSQSLYHPTRPSSCGWQDMTVTVSCSRESQVFLSLILYLVSDAYYELVNEGSEQQCV